MSEGPQPDSSTDAPASGSPVAPAPEGPVGPAPEGPVGPAPPSPIASAPVSGQPQPEAEVKQTASTPAETLDLAGVARRAAKALQSALASLVVAVLGLAATVYLGLVQNDLAMEQNDLAKQQNNLAEGQNRLAQKQLELMVKQDEIFDRRANLTMSVTKVDRDNYELVVTNTGKRTAQDFYYTIRFDSFMSRGNGSFGGSGGCSRREDGPKAMVLTGLVSGAPLYPTRNITIGNVGYWRTPATTIEWQIVSEDGAFPTKQSDTVERSTGTFGRIEVANDTGEPRPKDFKDPCG